VRICGRLLVASLVLLAANPTLCRAQPSQPVITSIRPAGTNVVVTVSVPSGIRRITLESRARLGRGAWVPAAVAQTDGQETTVSFRLACTRQRELLRARADFLLPLPAAFYGGANSFAGPPTNAVIPPTLIGLGRDGTGVVVPEGATREVVESDIWQLKGDTLYFFNQFRGLQIIDIAHPDNASVLGTLDLPAAGEQMYLAGSEHVVLLARSGGCGQEEQSEVLIVAVPNGQPQVVTNLPITGWIRESRMVGTALYVASETYRPVSGADNTTWEWGTLVSAFDLADPALPIDRGTLWYPGYGNVVTATDTYLFVVTQDPTSWWQSSVGIIDITAPDGTMARHGSVRTGGRIIDKFKLNYAEGVLTTISEDWGTGSLRVTRLETFRLPEPGAGGPGDIAKLGELKLGGGERLHATRFAGKLVYVVTFFQVDPLWVVDLSDPARPRIAGALEVPGWSTYIVPLGARLVTVGVETNRVAVSLFDVHDPSSPTLLSRVLLGASYSWSSANNDEKAFTVLPDAGLILVPYSGDTTNGWTSQVQLIDLTPTELVARGVIRHQLQPRRAALSHDRILSLSGWELLSVDATDRDHPVVRGATELAWPVDRVLLHGDYLLEVTKSTGWWGHESPPGIRVTFASEPARVIDRLPLAKLPLTGAAVKDNRLYLAQSQAASFPPVSTDAPNFLVTIVDLANLPALPVLNKAEVTADLSAWGGEWQALWPKPGLLVWSGGSYNYPGLDYLWLGGPVDGGLVWMPWPIQGFGQGSGLLLAFDVSQDPGPEFVSEVNLLTNDWCSFSQAFSFGSCIYFSHTTSELMPGPQPPGTWVQRYYLDVVDFADPVSPTLRKPVNVPGTLQGLSHAGELLYTTGFRWKENGTTDWTEWLDASAYDGVSAHLVASLPLPESWPHPVLVAGANVFVGRPGYSPTTTDVVAHQLETWALANTGIFQRLGACKLGAPASVLLERDNLLAVQETDNSVDLFDATMPAALSLVGQDRPAGCLWFDLSQADGTLDDGLWVPLSIYGVFKIHPGL